MDNDGYPEEEELEQIRNWPHTDFKGLMEFVKTRWAYASWGWSEPEPGVFKISTAGWSGNESIIEALKGNTMFWMTSWESSRRGGHYEFRIPAALWRDTPEG